MKPRTYSTVLTKEDLINCGLKNLEIDETAQSIKFIRPNDSELGLNKTNSGYYILNLWDKVAKKYRALTLQRAVYAWFYGSVPEGMVVDHVDNQHQDIWDYRPENLQLLTSGQNLAKNRKPTQYIPNMPKKKQYTEQYIQNKINYYTNRVEAAKTALRVCGSKEERKYYNDVWHKERSSVAQWKRKLQIFREEIK